MSDEYYKQIFTIVIVGSFITLLVVAFSISFVYLYQKRHFGFLQEKQRLQSQFQEELLKTQLEIQEQTFKTISDEIHDNIGQTLSFIKLSINRVFTTLPEAEQEKLTEPKDLLTKVITDLRTLSKTLNTDFIQQIGLASAVRQQLDLLQRTELYETRLVIEGEQEKYSVQRELVLYRIIQELLNNIVKHADAGSVLVHMVYGPDKLRVLVRDDGKGFDVAATRQAANQGLGLRNMLNRVSLIHGTIDIESEAGKGTTVNIELSKSNEV
ncbi:MAG: ATP-binding protein [Chitinophaga rupis]